ncbi:MAG: 50S ribosomal protein L17 [Candidatus Shapirobacteria bacterium]
MRHRMAGKKLNRNTHQRKALFRGLISSLFINGRLETTEMRAKAVQRLAEKLITKARVGSLHSQRLVAAFLQNRLAIEKAVKVWGPLFKSRAGGFTRIIRLGRRRGDDAMKARLEFTAPPPTEKDAKDTDAKKK